MSTRVALYARFSCDKQRDASIEDQVDACTEYCERREGYTVVATYCDYAISGRSDDRPQFLRMVEDAQNGVFDVIVLWKLDRFARNMEDQYYYEHILSRAGVHIESVKEDIAGKGIEATSVKALTALFAQIRSQQSAEDTMRGMLGKARKCQYLGYRKLGYSHDGDTITLDEQWAPVARDIHMRYLQGTSVIGVTRWLKEQGIETLNGVAVSYNNVVHVLRDEWYAGVYTWGYEKDANGEAKLDCYGQRIPLVRVEGGVPAIVTMEEKHEVWRRLGMRKRYNMPNEYLLSGKATCARCGKPLHGVSGTSCNGKTYHYYCCHGRRNTCYGTMPQGILESKVAQCIRDMLADEELCATLAERHMAWQNDKHADDALEKAAKCELRGIRKRRENLMAAVADGMPYQDAKPSLEKLHAEEKAVNDRLDLAKRNRPSVSQSELLKFFKVAAEGALSDKELIDLFVATACLFDGKMAVAMNFSVAETTPYELECAFGLEKTDEPAVASSSDSLLVPQSTNETNTWAFTRPYAKIALLHNGIGLLIDLNAA